MSADLIPDREEKVRQAKELAKKYMRQGWGSRPSVFHAIWDLFETDINEEEFLKFCRILNPFHAPASAIYENEVGSGINNCGALSGALASFAMVHGVRYGTQGMLSPNDGGWEQIYKNIMANPDLSAEDKVRRYLDRLKRIGAGAYYQIVARFKKAMGTTDCLALRKPYCGGNPLSPRAFKICNQAVIESAGIVAGVILEYETNPEALEIGEGHVHLAELGKLEGR